VPGFNLVAYPKGDPRARYLLEVAGGIASPASSFQRVAALLQEARESFDLAPGLEVGLVGLALALELPRRSASALWTIGGCAGWTAHVIEQRMAGFMLHRRAKYISPQVSPP
jgi:citrate synthase